MIISGISLTFRQICFFYFCSKYLFNLVLILNSKQAKFKFKSSYNKQILKINKFLKVKIQYQTVKTIGCLILKFLTLLTQKYFLPILMSISTQFIDQLFNNQYFKHSLKTFNQLPQPKSQHQKYKTINFEIQTVIDDITEVLYTNFRTTIEKQCNHFYESNRLILEQIQTLKNKINSSSKLKTQSSTAQRDTKSKLQTSIFFDGDQQYDMRQIRKNIDQFQFDVENKVLINSFELQEQQKTYTDLQIQQKINASIQGSINRIQLSLEQKFEKYSQKLQHRIEQLKKTITSVVQAMNDPQYWNKDKGSKHGYKNDKIVPTTAFSKKQIKVEENLNTKSESSQIQSECDEVKNKEKYFEKVNNIEVRNPQQKNSQSKAIDSLNKSINFGRTKIKSLFGFKTSNEKPKNKQQSIQ